jgi:hypothetical protein
MNQNDEGFKHEHKFDYDGYCEARPDCRIHYADYIEWLENRIKILEAAKEI